jgi:hypothetical protein
MKYKLSDASNEEQQKFGEGLNKLLEELSLAFSVVINKVPIIIKLENGQEKNVFADEPSIIIQHKTELVEVEKGSIPSNNPEVNPLAKENENPTTTT